MSNRLFQTIIHQFKDVVGDRTIGVLDDNDVIIACSELGRIGETRVGIRETAGVENGPFSSGGFTCLLYTSSFSLPCKHGIRFAVLICLKTA